MCANLIEKCWLIACELLFVFLKDKKISIESKPSCTWRYHKVSAVRFTFFPIVPVREHMAITEIVCSAIMVVCAMLFSF